MQDERRTKSVVTNLGDDSDGAPRQADAGRSSSSRACGAPVQDERRAKSVVPNLGGGSDGAVRPRVYAQDLSPGTSSQFDGAPRRVEAGRSSSSQACGVPVPGERRTKSVVANLGDDSDGAVRSELVDGTSSQFGRAVEVATACFLGPGFEPE